MAQWPKPAKRQCPCKKVHASIRRRRASAPTRLGPRSMVSNTPPTRLRKRNTSDTSSTSDTSALIQNPRETSKRAPRTQTTSRKSMPATSTPKRSSRRSTPPVEPMVSKDAPDVQECSSKTGGSADGCSPRRVGSSWLHRMKRCLDLHCRMHE